MAILVTDLTHKLHCIDEARLDFAFNVEHGPFCRDPTRFFDDISSSSETMCRLIHGY